ncbi:hypothetical protein ASF83_06020 [Plantibacter sp. Leaf171]|uniref:hypothetical protein n=1 Tax=unclassified Plantibacter TaxID=2624265 RepID=UPI0006FEA6D5|nr:MULTISPECIES: hypothetical protein [unclassified Plantibacter]KQM15519.1 hypothetical protein ASE44_06035 [Plantibacter sp. Leaf1]KQR58663.1 hypothetical protein ASF83_06020 [Plantibacter sp. Leaf171]
MTGPRSGPAGRDLRTDDGSTILLTIGFAAVTLAVVLVGIAATSLYVEHKRLLGLADRLAATAAESFSIDDVVMLPDGSFRPVLDDAAVASSARATLAAEGPGTLTGVEILEAVTPDGRGAEVSLASEWRPPMLTLFVPTGVRIEATASARSVFW